MAAQQGDAGAYYNIGLIHDKRGEGDKARACYLEAAKQEHPKALYNLGVVMELQDRDLAQQYYKRAMDGGHVQAAYRLGQLSR